MASSYFNAVAVVVLLLLFCCCCVFLSVANAPKLHRIALESTEKQYKYSAVCLLPWLSH